MLNNNQPNELSDADSMDADDYFERGIEYGLHDDYEHAIADLTHAIQLDPTKAKYHYQRGSRHFIHSNWSEAIDDLTEALRLQPDPADDVWNFTVDEIFHLRGIAYRYQGDYEAAIADFTELIKLQPAESRYYRDRSAMYKLMGDFDNSLADLNTMRQLEPDNHEYLFLLADLQRRQGNVVAAMATYDEYVEKSGAPSSYFYRGLLQKDQGKLDRAIADFREAIKLYPDYYSAYLELGSAYLANGSFKKAVNILTDLMEREPGFRYVALLWRGRANRAAGNTKAARKDLVETVKVNTNVLAENSAFYPGYVYRGHAHAELGHIKDALADYRMALETQPTHPDANRMREYITNHSEDVTHN